MDRGDVLVSLHRVQDIFGKAPQHGVVKHEHPPGVQSDAEHFLRAEIRDGKHHAAPVDELLCGGAGPAFDAFHFHGVEKQVHVNFLASILLRIQMLLQFLDDFGKARVRHHEHDHGLAHPVFLRQLKGYTELLHLLQHPLDIFLPTLHTARGVEIHAEGHDLALAVVYGRIRPQHIAGSRVLFVRAWVEHCLKLLLGRAREFCVGGFERHIRVGRILVLVDDGFKHLWAREPDVLVEAFVKDIPRLELALEGLANAKISRKLEVTNALLSCHNFLEGFDLAINAVHQRRNRVPHSAAHVVLGHVLKAFQSVRPQFGAQHVIHHRRVHGEALQHLVDLVSGKPAAEPGLHGLFRERGTNLVGFTARDGPRETLEKTRVVRGVQVEAQRFPHDCAELFRVQSSQHALVYGWFEEGVARLDKVIDARVETYAEPVPLPTRELDGLLVLSVCTCIDLEFLRERITQCFVHQLPAQRWSGGANPAPGQTRCSAEKCCDRRIARLAGPAHHPVGKQTFLHCEHRSRHRRVHGGLLRCWQTFLHREHRRVHGGLLRCWLCLCSG